MDTLLEAALRLPEPERIRLAEQLLDSVGPPSLGLSPEQIAEIRLRLHALEQGTLEMVSWEEMFASSQK